MRTTVGKQALYEDGRHVEVQNEVPNYLDLASDE